MSYFILVPNMGKIPFSILAKPKFCKNVSMLSFKCIKYNMYIILLCPIHLCCKHGKFPMFMCGSEEDFFNVFLCTSMVQTQSPYGEAPIWSQGHHSKKLGQGPQGNARYQSSTICTKWFWRRRFLRIP